MRWEAHLDDVPRPWRTGPAGAAGASRPSRTPPVTPVVVLVDLDHDVDDPRSITRLAGTFAELLGLLRSP